MNKSAISSSNEIWSLLKETGQQIKTLSAETSKQLKTLSVETDKLRASQKETDEQMKKTDAQIKETDKQMKKTDEQMKKTDAQIKETDKQMKKTDIRIDKIIGDFGNRWGKLGENLIKGSLVQRLNDRGIKVERVITNAKNGSSEFDIIAINGTETVVVEVKATLDPSDVQKFTESIKQFKTLWPEFKDKTIYGAMAFLIRANRQADGLAQKQGFFVISATGDVIIQNKKDFQPKVFN